MRELTIEQKAKAYDEAIERAKKEWIENLDNCYKNYREHLEIIFPELAESDDEKIREEILDYIDKATGCERWVAWLEKQGKKELENYDEAEKEKVDFVGDGFIECHADFLDFKEGETYWLEYIGDDKYNVRSDNLLGKTYHITPCQLYTVFKKLTWLEKQGQTFTKKDIDDAYLKGVTDTKNEIEKQYESNYQIRKDIATFIFNYRGDIKDRAKWMNYLGIKVSFDEKQGEQKPADNVEPTDYNSIDPHFGKPIDKVEPKFNEGDWIIFNGLSLLIKEVVQGYYRTISVDGISTSYDWDIDNVARLWTISDARDGDVLVNGSNIFIFHFINDTRLMGYCHVNTDDGRFYDDMGKNECFCLIDAVVNPATAEQCDLLFSKMHESGYEFNFEKKELKRIEPKFHEGDWAVSKLDGKARQISEVHFDEYNSYYVVEERDVNLEEYDRLHHLWTIDDVKDGDVLISQYGKPFIYNGNRDSFNVGSYCGITTVNRFEVATEECRWTENVNIHPATKEQRDTLLKAMADAGYTFDFKKKELRKLKFRVGDEIKPDNEESLTITKIDENGYWSEDLFICGFDDAAKWEFCQ